TNGCQHGITPPDVFGDGQDVLVTVAIGSTEIAKLAGGASYGNKELVQPVRARAVVLGGLAAKDPIGSSPFQSAARFANHDDAATLFAKLRIDAGRLQKIKQVLQRVVVGVVSLEINARRAQPSVGRQLVVIGTSQSLKERASAEVRATDPKDHDPI